MLQGGAQKLICINIEHFPVVSGNTNSTESVLCAFNIQYHPFLSLILLFPFLTAKHFVALGTETHIAQTSMFIMYV